MATVKLTKRIIEAEKPQAKDVFLWDNELKGFCCKITPTGKRAYLLYYRTKEGQQRKPKLGDHGAITCEQARVIATKILGEVAAGKDPSQNKREEQQAPTMGMLCERYLKEYANIRKKQGSVENDKRFIATYILPTFGTKKVTALTRADVIKLHHKLSDTPYNANRLLACLSKMMNLAEKWGWRPDGTNPCRHVEKYKETKRERFLSQQELLTLAEVLVALEAEGRELPAVLYAIRLLILTGCRRNEVLTLKRSYMDWEKGVINLPDSKTGKKTIFLSPVALELIQSIPVQENNPYLIMGAKTGNHLVNLEKPWRRIRKLAGLEDVRLHDLRHTYASIGAAMGLSLPMIGKLLGHAQVQTTARYAHLADNPLKQASSSIGSELMAAMSGKSSGEVILLHERKSL